MSTAAWRQPMVWLVAGLPAACVAALVSLIVVAAGEGVTDTVRDERRATAQLPVAETAADERAQALGLRASVERAGGRLHVRPLAGRWPQAETLDLTAAHPSLAREDRLLHLTRDGDGSWSLAAGLDTDHDWLLSLTDGTDEWRLRGRLRRGELAVELRSAVPTP